MRKSKTREGFTYRRRDEGSVQKRVNQSGGSFDAIFHNDFTVWKPKDGTNRIRFLPPTWEGAEHFGLDIYVHYGVGSDNQSYLCLDKNAGKTCPICEERRRAEAAGDSEYAKQLSPNKRVLVWVIDRDDEESGPLLWPMPWTVDRDYASLSVDKRSREVLFLDSPEEGYDVEFTKSGAKMKTKYTAAKVDRRPSLLSEDEETLEAWLAFIQEHPLPTVLQFFDSEHIAKVASGKVATKEDEDEEEDSRGRSRSRSKGRLPRDEDAEDDEEDEEEDEEEDDTRHPTRGSAGRRKTTKSRSELDEEDEEDEEEEDTPPSRKSATSKPSADEDEDEDEDDFDCAACSDTGRNSKGGYCVCAKGRRLKQRAER